MASAPRRDLFRLEPDALSRRTIALGLAAIYALGVALRLVWLARIGWHQPDLQWHGTPLLTSGDGYWFASGAGRLLTDGWGDDPRLPLPGDHALVALTWLVARVGPWTLDQVILYLPAVLGPLLAIPLVLIGRALSLSRLGLAAGVALVVAPGLVARTSAGYFDTDPFALGVPLVAAYHLVRLFEGGGARDALAAALWLAAYPWLYNQGAPLGLALAATAALGVWLARRSAPWASSAWLVLAASQVPLHPFVRVAAVVAVYLAQRWVGARALRLPRAAVVAAVAVVGGLIAWRMGPIVAAKIGYFLGDHPADTAALAFEDPTQLVSETRRQGLGELATRFAGSAPLLLLEAAGVVMLAWRRRSLLVLAPVAALGLFTAIGGMRFGIYLVPLLALGLAYAACWIAERVRVRWAPWLIAALTAAALAPSVVRDWLMFGRMPLVNAEVAALDELRTHAARDATTIAWWDDGYPVQYFARTRTLIDGGRRDVDAGLVAEILMSPSQRGSANLARLALATRDGGLPADWAIAPTLFERAREATGLDMDAFVAKLASPDYAAPPARAPIYFYLPLRLLAIVPAIDALRPHEPGVTRAPPFYRWQVGVTTSGTTIALPSGGEVDADGLFVKDAGGARPLRTIYSLRGSGPTLEMRTRTRHPEAPTSGIYLHDPGIFIELDERLLSSTLIQLLVFERAEPGVFEPVTSNAAARVFAIPAAP